MAFVSPSETQSGLRCPSSVVRSLLGLAALLLASLRFPDSSHGVVKVPPLHRHRRLVSTPVGFAAPKSCHLASSRGNSPGDAEPTSARGCHVPDSFRPCRSSRLRRFAPPGTLQVCCTLLPILGFAMFPVVRVVSRRLTRPPARAGECLGFRSPSGCTPRGLPSRFLPPTMSPGSPDPGGPCSH
jgi:hypothetical protein